MSKVDKLWCSKNTNTNNSKLKGLVKKKVHHFLFMKGRNKKIKRDLGCNLNIKSRYI